MKTLPWLLLALLAVLWLLARRTTQVPQPTVTTVHIRDSARTDSILIRTQVDTVIRWLKRAPVDTLAAILRDRARRPVLLAQDTVLPGLAGPADTAADTAQDTACLSGDVLAATAARQTADSAQRVLDQWQIRILETRADSLAQGWARCQEDHQGVVRAWGRGFLAGSVAGGAAGLAACLVLK